MRKRLLISFCALLCCSGVALGDDNDDKVRDAINKIILKSFGSIVAEATSTSTTYTYYFKMNNLYFPGGNSPVLFPIICTLTTLPPPAIYFCAATVPASVGVPSSFPTSFFSPKSP